MIKTVLVFLFVFGLIVIIHELGHFIFAKRSGILVREFAIGMGPKIFSHRDKSGTAYTIRLLPVGGYVRMAGMGEEEVEFTPGKSISLELNEQQEVVRINTSHKVQLTHSVPMEVLEADLEDALFIRGYINGDDSKEVTYSVDHDAMIIEEDGLEVRIAPRDVQFQSAKLYQRLLTNFAGPLFNFILTFILFLIILFAQGGEQKNDPTSVIGGVTSGSPAEKAGLKAQDKIIEINGQKISQYDEIREAIQKTGDKDLSLVIERKGDTKNVTLKPEKQTENSVTRLVIGVQNNVITTKMNVGQKIVTAAKQTKDNALLIFRELKNLVSGFSLDKLGGPVMIFQVSSKVSQQNSFISVLAFTAMLSVNLGIMNLLPIPMLDGGKILFNIFEGIRRKPLSQEIEMRITLVFAGLLVLLFVLVTWNDIMRFIG